MKVWREFRDQLDQSLVDLGVAAAYVAPGDKINSLKNDFMKVRG